MQAFEKVVENLQAKIELQAQVLNSLVTKADMTNLEAKADEIKTMLVNLNVRQEEQVASFKKLELQSGTQDPSFIRVENVLENQTSVPNTLVTKEEMQSNNLTNLEAKVRVFGDGEETLTKGRQKLRASKGLVKGIIAGTDSGVVIIPMDSREQRTISSDPTTGVAFNWHSHKVYWIEFGVGIKMADLDGSSAELLISDTSEVCVLAVDQITGNFYYGILGLNPRIRVCDSMGEKCANFASEDNNLEMQTIADIAVFPSEGLMFWSRLSDKASITRANMDGTNATVIILDRACGLNIDELTGNLYWANLRKTSIGYQDFNGNNRNILLNATIQSFDIAVDGDTVYLGGSKPSGVYSVASDRKVTFIANTTEFVNHIALYGRNKVSSRPNPCKNSPCANFCVLNRVSYTCL